MDPRSPRTRCTRRTRHRSRHRALLLASLLALAPLAAAACGSDDDTSTSPDATTAAAGSSADDGDGAGSYEIVPAAEVAAGLATTITTLGTLAADPSTATDEAVGEVFESWEGYEGTIKQNEVASYLDLEDALAQFKDGAEAGDAAKMAAATGAFSAAAADYLAKHPG